MAGAMVVIEPRLPECLAGKAIKMRSCHTLREHGGAERDMSGEDAGDMILDCHGRRIWSGPDRSRDIGCAIIVLAAAIDQKNLVRSNGAVGLWRYAIMNNGAVLTGAGYRGKTFPPKMGTLAAKFQQLGGGAYLRFAARGCRF